MGAEREIRRREVRPTTEPPAYEPKTAPAPAKPVEAPREPVHQ